MAEMATVKVTSDTRNELKRLAENRGASIEVVVRHLLRMERQRQMGHDLASAGPGDTEPAWVAGTSQTAARALR